MFVNKNKMQNLLSTHVQYIFLNFKNQLLLCFKFFGSNLLQQSCCKKSITPFNLFQTIFDLVEVSIGTTHWTI